MPSKYDGIDHIIVHPNTLRKLADRPADSLEFNFPMLPPIYLSSVVAEDRIYLMDKMTLSSGLPKKFFEEPEPSSRSAMKEHMAYRYSAKVRTSLRPEVEAELTSNLGKAIEDNLTDLMWSGLSKMMSSGYENWISRRESRDPNRQPWETLMNWANRLDRTGKLDDPHWRWEYVKAVWRKIWNWRLGGDRDYYWTEYKDEADE